MITRIHVSQPNIRANGKHGTDLPVIGARRYRERKDGKGHIKNADVVEYGHVAIVMKDGVEVARVCYGPENPLECGAKVWIETTNEVEVQTRD